MSLLWTSPLADSRRHKGCGTISPHLFVESTGVGCEGLMFHGESKEAGWFCLAFRFDLGFEGASVR